jgi:UDP-galactose transporter
MDKLSPRVLSFVGLVTIQVSIALVYKLSQTNGQYKFSQASALAMAEAAKFIISIALYSATIKQRDVKEVWKQWKKDVPWDLMRQMMGLALLYAFNNHLAFTVFTVADPGTIQLVKSGSTLLTAFILFFALLRPVSQLQWMAIVMQVAGLIISQYNECAGTTRASPLAYALLAMQVTITAVSGAWNDHVTKANATISLHAINMALYSSGFTINFLVFLTRQMMGIEPGFFQGYDSPMAIMVIVMNSFMGIAITAVYKFADAIIKTFATTFSTGVLLLLSALFFAAPVTLTASLGVLVVFIATYIYMTNPATSTDVPPFVLMVRDFFQSKLVWMVCAAVAVMGSVWILSLL